MRMRIDRIEGISTSNVECATTSVKVVKGEDLGQERLMCRSRRDVVYGMMVD